MGDDPWVTLGGGGQVLVAIVNQPYRPAGLAGQQCRMDRYYGRVLFFPAKATARFGLDDHRLLVGQVQRSSEGPVDVVGALERPDHSDGPFPLPPSLFSRNSDGPLRL